MNDDPVVGALKDLLERNKLNRNSFLYHFIKCQLAILGSQNPNGIRWFNDESSCKVFQFYADLFQFARKRGYETVVGESQWRKNDNGDNEFTGRVAAPCAKTISRIIRLFQFPPGLCDTPLIVISNFLRNKKVSKAALLISGDEIHIRQGLVRSSKNGDVIWTGTLCYDVNNELADVISGSDSSTDAEDEEEIEFTTDTVVENNIAYFNNLKTLKEKNGTKATKILQFALTVVSPDLEVPVRIPICYFLTSSITAQDFHVIITSVFNYIYRFANQNFKKYGIHTYDVDSLTFDGDTAVWSWLKEYGEVEKDGIKHRFKIIGQFVPDGKTFLFFS